MVRLLTALTLALLLSGCNFNGAPSTHQFIAACEKAASDKFPGQILEASTDIGKYMRDCMTFNHFTYDPKRTFCLARYDSERESACYRDDGYPLK